MIFSEFCAGIISLNVRHVAEHWNEVRKTRTIPSWADIQPSAIKNQLPIIWAYTYDAAEDEFFGRLAGETVHKIFDCNFRGERMSVLQKAFDKPRLFERAKRVINAPAIFHGLGAVFQKNEDNCVGERIIMPLASNGRDPDGIFGVTEFKVQKLKADIQSDEVERWFTL